MPNVTVRLRKYNSKITDESQVETVIQYQSKKYPIAVPDIKLNPQYFSKVENNWLTQTYTNTYGIERKKTAINSKIKEFRNEVYRVLSICIKRVEIDKDFSISSKTVKALLNKSEEEILTIKKKAIEDDYYSSSFIEEYKKFTKTYDNENTRKNLYQTVALLVAYQRDSKIKLSINSFDVKMLTDFVEFLLDFGLRKDGKKVDDYIHSTLHKLTFKNLNRFRNYLVDKLKKNVPSLSDYDFEKLVEVTELEPLNPQALTYEELNALFYYDFKSKAQTNTKRLFFLGFSIGGQRISDTLAIASNKQYLDSSGIIDFSQIKTKNYLENPIFTGFMEKLDGEVIYTVTEQEVNRNLKGMIRTILGDEEFMKNVKDLYGEELFNRQVRFVNYKGRKNCRFTERKDLVDDISFKYVRSTFISVLIFKYKKTREEVASFTGHKDLTIIDYYLSQFHNIKQKTSEEVKPDEKYNIGEVVKEVREVGSAIDTDDDLLDAAGIEPDER